MAVKLYSYDDVGAPVLGDSNDGSLLSILRACLVDGYGTRTAAGWTMPFSDLPNRKAVFKPIISNVNLWLDDNLSYQYAYVRGYGTMTGIDTGIEQFPRDVDMITNYHYAVSKKASTVAGYERWHVIADNEWFYFINHHLLESSPAGFFFGKMNHVDENYVNPFLLTGHEVLSTLIGTSQSFSLVSPVEWWIKEKYTLIGEPEGVDLFRDGRLYPNPNPITGKIEMGQLELSRLLTPYVRHGRMPNFYQALGNDCIVYSSADKIVIDTIKYLVLMKGNDMYLYKYEIDAG